MKICLSYDIADAIGAEVAAVAPDAELVWIGRDGRFSGDPDGAEILVFSPDVVRTPAMLASVGKVMGSDGLRWVQSPGAGVDHPVFGVLLERGVRVTNGSGLHAEPIAQYIFAYVLHWERNVARHTAQQAERKWEIVVSDDLTAKTLGIVGLGGIGLAAARVAKAFGMRVVGTRRTPVASANVDEVHATGELHRLLGEAHYVVLCVPLTNDTRHLVGRAELDAMRRDAVLINVARGDVVDQEALAEALRARRIRGATLDVVSPEPLPADSPLWSLENCILTPHDAGYSPRAGERLAALFLDNLGRYARGEPLVNEVTDVGLAHRR